MYTDEEMRVLNKLAKKIYKCKFKELTEEEQDELYCYAEDNELFERE